MAAAKYEKNIGVKQYPLDSLWFHHHHLKQHHQRRYIRAGSVYRIHLRTIANHLSPLKVTGRYYPSGMQIGKEHDLKAFLKIMSNFQMTVTSKGNVLLLKVLLVSAGLAPFDIWAAVLPG